MFISFDDVRARIKGPIEKCLPSHVGPIQFGISLITRQITPVRAATVLSLMSANEQVELAAALELMNISIHHLHHNLDDESREASGLGTAGEVLVGDYLSTGAFRLLVKCSGVETMRLIADAAQRACEAELVDSMRTMNGVQSLSSMERRAASFGEVAGLVGAIAAEYDSRLMLLAGQYGGHLAVAQAFIDGIDDSASRHIATRAEEALTHAVIAARAISSLCGNMQPLKVCAAVKNNYESKMKWADTGTMPSHISSKY